MAIANPALPSVPDGLQVDQLTLEAAGLLISARITADRAFCPSCGWSSSRVHSAYRRNLKDLPRQGRSVTWCLKVRRFRCSHCPGRIFAERVSALGGRKARRCDRLAEAQTDIGMVLGGEPGARLARRLAMPVSGDTVLRLIRRRGILSAPPPRVVGIDDWAWPTPGCQQPGDPGGGGAAPTAPSSVISSGGVSSTCCLAVPPGRCGTGSPAIQACPSSAAIARGPTPRLPGQARQRPFRSRIAGTLSSTLVMPCASSSSGIGPAYEAARLGRSAPVAPTVPAEDPPAPETAGRRRATCEAVLRRHGQGLPIKDIAWRTGASRNTVRRWVRAGRFVPYARAPGPSRLDHHLPFVEARWAQGQHSAAVLYRELGEAGFAGGYDIVRRWAAKRRHTSVKPLSAGIPSTRRITRWLTSDPAALSREERRFTQALAAAAPGLAQPAAPVGTFASLLHDGDPAELGPWLEAAARGG